MLSLSAHLVRALLALTVLSGVSTAAPWTPWGEYIAPGKAKTTGGVATESKECSLIGKTILLEGGNAVDAMVGMTFCIGVVAMYHSGIGGGGFMLVRDSKGQFEAIDFRETAPSDASEDMYLGNVNGSVVGGLAAGVPGEVAGLEYAHQKYGKLEWQHIVRKAANLASEGFVVSSDMVRYMDTTIVNGTSYLVTDESWKIDFAKDGRLIRAGEVMTRPRLAATLEKIAAGGAKAFYTGKLAESMVKTIQENNGTLTLEDFADYKAVSRPVIETEYKGFGVYGIGSPASGAVSLNILKTLERYEEQLDDASVTGPSRDAFVHDEQHYFVEASRFAYGARAELGDPGFVSNVSKLEKQMVTREAGDKIFHKIDPNRTQSVGAYDPDKLYTNEGHGTSHLVSADRDGFAVSLTSTVNLLFGSQLMDYETGIVLNNEMNDFSIPGHRNEFGFEPSAANFIRPRKRPLSSITPIIVTERAKGDRFVAALGAAGGSRIITSTTQVLWRLLHGADPHAAVAEGRLHDQLMPNKVLADPRVSAADVEALKGRAHEVEWVRDGLSAVQAVTLDRKTGFEAASEPRQKNSAGYSV